MLQFCDCQFGFWHTWFSENYLTLNIIPPLYTQKITVLYNNTERIKYHKKISYSITRPQGCVKSGSLCIQVHTGSVISKQTSHNRSILHFLAKQTAQWKLRAREWLWSCDSKQSHTKCTDISKKSCCPQLLHGRLSCSRKLKLKYTHTMNDMAIQASYSNYDKTMCQYFHNNQRTCAGVEPKNPMTKLERKSILKNVTVWR